MDVNSTIPYALVPFVNTVESLMKTVSVFVGGIFGLYVLMFVWRLFVYKRNRSLFKGMRRDFNKMQKQITILEKKIDSLKRSQAKMNTKDKPSKTKYVKKPDKKR